MVTQVVQIAHTRYHYREVKVGGKMAGALHSMQVIVCDGTTHSTRPSHEQLSASFVRACAG